jgi:hypothetical protein
MRAVVWFKGEVLYYLSDGTRDAVGGNMFKTGNDIYVCGYEFDAENAFRQAKVWKNGVEYCNLSQSALDRAELNLDSTAYDLWVDNDGIVYVCGFETNPNISGSAIAKVWRITAQNQGELLTSLSSIHSMKANYAEAFSIEVHGDYAYICGYEIKNSTDDNTSNDIREARVWKVNIGTGARLWNNNGGYPLPTPPIGTTTVLDSEAYDLIFENNTVLRVAGYQLNSDGAAVSLTWRVGSLDEAMPAVVSRNVDVPSNRQNVGPHDKNPYTNSTRSGIDKDSNDVIYTSGGVQTSSNDVILKVWKEGTEIYNLTSGNYDASAYTLIYHEGKVYVSGWERNNRGIMVGKIWENDTELVALTDSARPGSVNAITF